MKIHLLLIGLVAIAATGCAEKKQEAPAPEADPAPAAEATQPADTTEPEAMGDETAELGTDAFLRHMHQHAGKLEDLNAALADGDLAAARTPAYWLVGHEEVSAIPEDWRVHMRRMRDGADAVSLAEDLDAARAAAISISEGCDGCHADADVDVPGPSTE